MVAGSAISVHVGHYGSFGAMDWKRCRGLHGQAAGPPGGGKHGQVLGTREIKGPFGAFCVSPAPPNVAAARRGCGGRSLLLLSACCKQCAQQC